MKNIANLIDSYIDKKINYDQFFQQISNFYGEENPGWNHLKEDEQDFVYEIYEKSTYTAEGLPKDDGDRKHGVIDEEDFREWLKEMKERNIQFWK